MAYDEQLAERIRHILGAHPAQTERRMFGGLAFMLEGRMFCGIIGEDLMVRVGPAAAPKLLARPHVRPMDFTGRPMRGYVFVGPEGILTAKALEFWLDAGVRCVEALAAVEAAGAGRKGRTTTSAAGRKRRA